MMIIEIIISSTLQEKHKNNSVNKSTSTNPGNEDEISSEPNTNLDTNGGTTALAGGVSTIWKSLSSSMSSAMVSISQTGIPSGTEGGSTNITTISTIYSTGRALPSARGG